MPLAMKRIGLIESNRVFHVKISSIHPNPGQPRRVFDSTGLRDLAESIKMYGVLQPLTLRKLSSGEYELIAGERRLRASQLAGLRDVPCIILGADEKQSSLIALVENLQRCDLDFFEEAEGLQRLIYRFGLSQEEAARRVGKSQSAVANKLRLLRHTPEIIAKIRENGLTERHARALLRLESEEDRLVVVDTIVARKLNVSQTDEYIEDYIRSLSSEKEEVPTVGRMQTLFVFKDMRLFLNTVTRAVDTMRRAGVHTEYEKAETPEETVVTVRIRKGAAVK